MAQLGTMSKLESILQSAGMETYCYTKVENDPAIETVLDGAKSQMQEFCPDFIVALGGGSCIDAAKGMWVFYEHPELTFEKILHDGGIPTLRHKAFGGYTLHQRNRKRGTSFAVNFRTTRLK